MFILISMSYQNVYSVSKIHTPLLLNCALSSFLDPPYLLSPRVYSLFRRLIQFYKYFFTLCIINHTSHSPPPAPTFSSGSWATGLHHFLIGIGSFFDTSLLLKLLPRGLSCTTVIYRISPLYRSVHYDSFVLYAFPLTQRFLFLYFYFFLITRAVFLQMWYF